MPTLLDKEFKYTQSGKTDIRKTFAKARKAMEAKQAAEAAAAVKPAQIFTYRKAVK